MNTLVYADVPRERNQQRQFDQPAFQRLSVSFAVAAAGLTTVFFIPDSLRANPGAMIGGLHEAFLALGAFTILLDPGLRQAQARRRGQREPGRRISISDGRALSPARLVPGGQSRLSSEGRVSWHRRFRVSRQKTTEYTNIYSEFAEATCRLSKSELRDNILGCKTFVGQVYLRANLGVLHLFVALSNRRAALARCRRTHRAVR